MQTLARFWTEVAPTNIELNSNIWVILSVKDRKYALCVTEIDLECYVLFHCPLFEDIRDIFYQSINYYELSDDDKTCFFISNPICANLEGRTYYNILDRRRVLSSM